MLYANRKKYNIPIKSAKSAKILLLMIICYKVKKVVLTGFEPVITTKEFYVPSLLSPPKI